MGQQPSSRGKKGTIHKRAHSPKPAGDTAEFAFVPMNAAPYSVRMMARRGSMTRAPALLASLGIFCVTVFGSARAAIAAEKVTYLLPAPITLPAFGPWVVAQQRGYYAAEDLEVSFQTANGGADVAKQVGVGNAVI